MAILPGLWPLVTAAHTSVYFFRPLFCTHARRAPSIDHAGSASRLAAATGAPVYTHSGDAGHVREGTHYQKLRARTLLGHMILLRRPPTSVEATPLAGEMTDGDDISGMRVVHAPGHSPGQVVFLWPRHGGVLILGDAVFNFAYVPWILRVPRNRRRRVQAGHANVPSGRPVRLLHGRRAARRRGLWQQRGR